MAAQLADRSTILTVWVVGGLYTLLGSVCLTELGTMLPQAGGYYVYARRAFGDTAGFAVGWTDWLTYCAVLGYVSIGMSEFVALLVPSLAGAVTPVAVALLLAFVGLQWMGIRVSSRFQEIATALKFVAFLALVAACFAVVAGSRSGSPRDGRSPIRADAGRRRRRAAVGRHHLRRLAERAVLHRGRSRSGAQPSAIDDWRRDRRSSSSTCW